MNIGKCPAIDSFHMEKLRISSGSPPEALFRTRHEYGTEKTIAARSQIKPPRYIISAAVVNQPMKA
jgi:hypothetical protein